MKKKDINKYEIKKYDYLDQLRGIAIIGVILTHMHYINLSFFTDSFLDKFFSIGGMGVPLFFILSSYTLSLSLYSRSKKEKNPIRNFYIRRFFRIYPLFFSITILVFLLFSYFTFNYNINFNFDTSIQNLLYHLSFLFGIIPKYLGSMYMGEWSLFNELFFYLLFPFIFKLTEKKIKVTFLLLLISFFLSYFSNILSSIYNFYDLYGTPITHMYSFMLGILLFQIKDINFSKKVYNVMIYINLFSFIILGYFYLTYGYLYIFPFFILNLFLLVFLFIKNVFIIKNLFIAEKLKFLGIISYSLYLINYWYYILLGILFNTFLIKYIGYNIAFELIYLFVIIIILLIISFFSYKYIEKKGISFGSSIINNLGNKNE